MTSLQPASLLWRARPGTGTVDNGLPTRQPDRMAWPSVRRPVRQYVAFNQTLAILFLTVSQPDRGARRGGNRPGAKEP